VFADFVEEEGDPARGEFIRVQVALARTPEHDPARRALEDREHALLAEHEARWLGVAPDADGLHEWHFERGFVHEVAATPSFMLDEGADLCADHPVLRWRVQSSQGDLPEDLREAGQRPWFGRLEAIDLAGWYTTIGELERFLTRSGFARLRELDLTDRPGLDELPAILERAPFREQLKILRCGGGYPGEAGRLDCWDLVAALAPTQLAELTAAGCELTSGDVRALLEAKCCRELASLDIRDNHIEPDGWDAFRGVRCRLRELDLSGTPLGGISLDSVLRQDSLSQLRVLEMNRCGSAMTNIRALAASPFWTQAEELRMQGGTIPEHSLDPLFASGGPPGLRVLDVSENYFRDAGVRRLCEAKWAESLTWLGLTRNYLTDEALRLIAGNPGFARLRTLHLAFNSNAHQEGADVNDRITDAGLVALTESPHLVNLRTLSFGFTDITAVGIEALVNAPHLRLTGLGLAGCRIPGRVIRLLADSPALARLEWLDLSDNHGTLDGDALMPLAESEYLSPLCELNIVRCFADDDTREAFRHRLGRRLSG
jgi:Ran GTPase-activating protein (RanGAP) involved in mRNA processing and transport